MGSHGITQSYMQTSHDYNHFDHMDERAPYITHTLKHKIVHTTVICTIVEIHHFLPAIWRAAHKTSLPLYLLSICVYACGPPTLWLSLLHLSIVWSSCNLTGQLPALDCMCQFIITARRRYNACHNYYSWA